MSINSNLSETSLIGETVQVDVNRWDQSYSGLHKYECSSLDRFPDDWTIWVTVPEENSLSVGDSVEGWIFDIDSRNKSITVTTDSFGQADLHTLKDRHVQAADHVSHLVIKNVRDSSTVDLDQVSHAKGLLSRCVRKDQWDWYTVYKLLGMPPEKRLKQGQQALSRLRNAAKRGDDDSVQDCINQLRSKGIAKRFGYFVRGVNQGEEYSVIDDEYLLMKLHSLNSSVFEQFVADLWAQLGWETEVVPNKKDRGADVIAVQNEIFTRKRAIQVKCKNPELTHNLDEVQRYMALSLRDDIDEALLLTTGQFTEKAHQEASISSYELVEGQDLTSFIREKNLEQIVQQYVGSPN